MPVSFLTLSLSTDHPVPIQPAGGSATITVTSGSLVYYSSDSQVSAGKNDGSIALSASATFINPVWVRSSGRSTVTVMIDSTSIVVGSGSALSTTASDGFLYIPMCAGTPTGTPTAHPGGVPLIYDTTANKLWLYNGSWRGVAVT